MAGNWVEDVEIIVVGLRTPAATRCWASNEAGGTTSFYCCALGDAA